MPSLDFFFRRASLDTAKTLRVCHTRGQHRLLFFFCSSSSFSSKRRAREVSRSWLHAKTPLQTFRRKPNETARHPRVELVCNGFVYGIDRESLVKPCWRGRQRRANEGDGE
jgi:hypothetical protein